jgi:ATP-dependent protease HslVU (ClpYQ) peptidase subunit
MTIAIGFSYGPLSIMASDSEVTVGSHAIEGGKISSMWRAELGKAEKVICFSGAGSAACSQALMSAIEGKFDGWRGSLDKFGVWTKKHVRDFYEQHCLSLVGSVTNPPSCRLLIMAEQNRQRRFWSTERTLLIPEHAFKAIGSGAPTATALLSSLYRPDLKLNMAVILATYVIFQVKRSVQGCGFKTEIRFLYNNRFGIVPLEFITKCEAVFERYRQLNKEFFYHAMGFPISIMPPLGPERAIQHVLTDVEAVRSELSKLEVIAGNTFF